MGSGFSNLSQNVLGLVALFVSLVALFTTVLQVLQQYFSSAEGYRRCAESVMGLWAGGTHRKLRFREFRIEVVFETPVIFIASPTNTRGPIKGKPITYVDGTEGSYTNTRVLSADDQEQADDAAKRSVHTADDETASWVTLLSSLQTKEKESRAWDKEQYFKPPKSPPRSISRSPLQSPREKVREPEYMLAVGVQSKTRSWDFIPSSITKPYATSAICHLVEMMAMLGLYWRNFDQQTWNLRAEGNGFILTSTTVHGLGVLVSFGVTGQSNFKENRVIPCGEVKELAFGTVPNIFDDLSYLKDKSEAQSFDLTFGSDNEVENTLESLGVQAATLKQYRKDHKHIFSVSFEIIGMLGKVFRIRGSSFKMLPNPTSDRWAKSIGPKASWKIHRMMYIFQGKVGELIKSDGFNEDHSILTWYDEEWQQIQDLGCPDEIVDENNMSLQMREAIHDSMEKVTSYLLNHSQADVLAVLVAHVTKVMAVLSDPVSPLNTIVLAVPNKEEALLNHYFDTIREQVIGNVDLGNNPPTKAEKDKRNAVWIALMYRMLCWFLLHDFDKMDVKIVPSDLKGSRMPVYIG